MNLTGKKILISGGTSGIGRATAVLLAQNGADLYIFGRHQQKLDEAITDIERFSGKKAIGFIADTADFSSIQKVFHSIDHLDVLINCAALPARSILTNDLERIKYVVDVNLTGYLVMSKLAIEKFRQQQQGGHIVNIGSMSAHTKDRETDLYVATKAAVEAFSETIRKLVNEETIKITLIEPGSVGTDMVSDSPKEQRVLEEKELMLKAEDIAECILFALTRPERTDILRIQAKPHKQIF
jgi:NADP-dependent 3-hydroxy acid dehydrogenase YdfG